MLAPSTTGLGALRAAVDVYYNFTGQTGDCYEYDGVETQSLRHWRRKGDGSRLHGTCTASTENGAQSTTHRRDQIKPVDVSLSLEEAWGYQTCTEVYQPMPTDGITDFEIPYTPNKTAYFEHCWKHYGVKPRPDWEEMTFMGSNIQSGTNIFLSNGQLDPWRAAGIQTKPTGAPASIIIRTIENGAHHLDLRASHPDDPPSVVAVRKEEKDAMRLWINKWKQMHDK